MGYRFQGGFMLPPEPPVEIFLRRWLEGASSYTKSVVSGSHVGYNQLHVLTRPLASLRFAIIYTHRSHFHLTFPIDHEMIAPLHYP